MEKTNKKELTAENLHKFIIERDFVSFAELQKNFDIEGDFTIESKEGAIFWAGCSEKFCDLMNGLCKEEKIYYRPANNFLYLIDGVYLNLPVAKSAKNLKGKWIPTSIRDIKKLTTEKPSFQKMYEANRKKRKG